MGYYTRFELESTSDGEVEMHIKNIADNLGFSIWELKGSSEMKWYDYSRDMIAYSKLYPDVLFKLSGEGADNADCWHEYYKNGKYQRCVAVLTYPEFDEKELR